MSDPIFKGPRPGFGQKRRRVRIAVIDIEVPSAVPGLAKLELGRHARSQVRYGESRGGIRDRLKSRVGHGDLNQLACFAFEVVELLPVGVLRPGLFQMEVDVDRSSRPVWRWGYNKRRPTQQCIVT